MRCFIAAEFDEAIKTRLAAAQAWFEGLPGKVSWTKPDHMHVTIKFLGEVPDNTIAAVSDMLKRCAAQIAPFECTVEGLGCFPAAGRQLRILWAAVTAPRALVTLNDLLQRGYVELGYPAEKRTFAPHLTIGRVRSTNHAQAYRDVIVRHPDFTAGTQHVDHIVLYQSLLKPTGAVYIPISTVNL